LELSVKTYKRKLDRELRHIKLILAHQRHHLPAAEWRRLVEETKASILNCPQDFFCIEIPSRNLFSDAIEKVFDGFLEDQRLLSMQSHKTFEKFFDSKKSLRRK
jgi:hypothetical protein